MGLAAFAGYLAGSLGRQMPRMRSLAANIGELRSSNGFVGQLMDMAKAEVLKIGETAIRSARPLFVRTCNRLPRTSG